jgi:Lrp/AsnC family transcriptional regulator, leucine-responsive regulatory protein
LNLIGIKTSLPENFQLSAVVQKVIRMSLANQVNLPLDELDARILTELSVDSRRSYAEVGKDVGLSTAAVHERVRKMVERGVIERFSLRIVPERVGLQLAAYVFIRNEAGVRCSEVSPRLRALPEVVELHSVAGEYDFLAKIRTTHARRLEDLLFEIKSVSGVARTTSTIVLTTDFEERAPWLGMAPAGAGQAA